MVGMREGRSEGLVPERPPTFNLPEEVRTRELTDDTYPPEDYATEPHEQTFGDPEDVADPIEVTVVGPIQGDEPTNWSSNSFTIGADVPVQLAGANRNRRKLILTCHEGVDTTTNDDVSGTDRVTTQTNLTGSGNSAEYVIPATDWTELIFALDVTSLTGVTPSVTVKIQETLDGTNWVDLVTFTAATAATYELQKTTTASSNRIRVVWTTSGTITDLDFTVDVMRFPVTRTSTTQSNYVQLTRGPVDAFPMGHRLLPGEQLELTHNDNVWALANDGSLVVSVANEFVVD